MTEIKFYYQIIRAEVLKTNTQDRVDEVKYIIDETAYDALSDTDRKKITAYDYETEVNDNKRYIRVINKDFIADVDYQYKQAMI
jgi:hypothetical protein